LARTDGKVGGFYGGEGIGKDKTSDPTLGSLGDTKIEKNAEKKEGPILQGEKDRTSQDKGN